jgi:hypothetical protein
LLWYESLSTKLHTVEKGLEEAFLQNTFHKVAIHFIMCINNIFYTVTQILHWAQILHIASIYYCEMWSWPAGIFNLAESPAKTACVGVVAVLSFHTFCTLKLCIYLEFVSEHISFFTPEYFDLYQIFVIPTE